MDVAIGNNTGVIMVIAAIVSIKHPTISKIPMDRKINTVGESDKDRNQFAAICGILSYVSTHPNTADDAMIHNDTMVCSAVFRRSAFRSDNFNCL